MKLSRVIFCLLVFATSALAARSPEFPSQGLEQRVDFWKKVFTQYGKDEVVIHDRIHVNLIYDIAGDGDLNSKMQRVRDALQEIRANVETPNNFGPTAQQMYIAIVDQGVPVSAGSIDQLLANIHTQRGIKERFRDGVIRSGRYVSDFQQILKSEGVPEELALLPLVESSFQNAKSSAGAIGVWQFTRSTGKLYNMRVSGKVDERLDPFKSTHAAARLLRDNQRALGVWPLAITAYNHGRGGMLHAQERLGSDIVKIIDQYDGPLFGYASMNFYSEFLAAVEVYEDYPTYFGQLALDNPGTPMPKTTTLAAAAPTKVASRTPTSKAKAGTVKAAASEKYKVRNGDTLYEIAQRFGTSVRDLMQRNNLRRSAIYAGQILSVK